MEKRGDDKTGTGRVILPFAIRKGYVYYVDEQGNFRYENRFARNP